MCRTPLRRAAGAPAFDPTWSRGEGGDSLADYNDLLAARRARALRVGLLSGGYGQEELERAGAYRVYQDPADLLRHLDELGIRGVEASLAPHERPGEMGERPRDASGGGSRHEGA